VRPEGGAELLNCEEPTNFRFWCDVSYVGCMVGVRLLVPDENGTPRLISKIQPLGDGGYAVLTPYTRPVRAG
jgi:hypothetical protein